MAKRVGRRAKVVAFGSAIAFSDQAASDTGDHKTYRIDSTARRVWDPTAAITVEDGGVATAEAFTVNRLLGTVTFATADATRVITITGKYLPSTEVAEAREWSVTLGAENGDSTVFGDEYTGREQVSKDVSGSIGRFAMADGLFRNAWAAGSEVVIGLWTDRTTADPEILVRAVLESDDEGAAVDALQMESVQWSGTPDADGRAVAFQ